MALPTSVNESTTPPNLWRNRSFNLLWSSQFLSGLGTNISGIAFPLLVLAITGSAISAGVVGTAAAAVRFALRIPAGVLVDRVNRKIVMLSWVSVRLVAAARLSLFVVSGHENLTVIMGLAVVEAVGGTVFETAELAAVSNVV